MRVCDFQSEQVYHAVFQGTGILSVYSLKSDVFGIVKLKACKNAMVQRDFRGFTYRCVVCITHTLVSHTKWIFSVACVLQKPVLEELYKIKLLEEVRDLIRIMS